MVGQNDVGTGLGCEAKTTRSNRDEDLMTRTVADHGVSSDEQARDWVLLLASGEATRIEIDACKAWLAADPDHRAAFERRRSAWQDLSRYPDIFVQPASRWRSRSRRVSRWVASRPVSALSGAVAAGLMAAFFAPQALLWAKADYRTSAEVLRIALPDGSLAVLDSEAAIAVAFSGQQRHVELLAGNAFFTVRHGDARPFRVAASGGVIEDIGTSFEVRREADGTVVGVAEGAVKVSPRGIAEAASLRLQEGETVAYDETGSLRRGRSRSSADIAAWREGELLIDASSVAAAMTAVGRYRRGPTWIWADLSGGEPVSGAFRTDRADEALRAIANEAGLSVRWLPGGVAIVTPR